MEPDTDERPEQHNLGWHDPRKPLWGRPASSEPYRAPLARRERKSARALAEWGEQIHSLLVQSKETEALWRAGHITNPADVAEAQSFFQFVADESDRYLAELREHYASQGWHDLEIGGVIFAVSLVISYVTYTSAAAGGTYIALVGPLLFGLIRALRGISRLLTHPSLPFVEPLSDGAE